MLALPSHIHADIPTARNSAAFCACWHCVFLSERSHVLAAMFLAEIGCGVESKYGMRAFADFQALRPAWVFAP
jgi:hypothetical protein